MLDPQILEEILEDFQAFKKASWSFSESECEVFKDELAHMLDDLVSSDIRTVRGRGLLLLQSFDDFEYHLQAIIDRLKGDKRNNHQIYSEHGFSREHSEKAIFKYLKHEIVTPFSQRPRESDACRLCGCSWASAEMMNECLKATPESPE